MYNLQYEAVQCNMALDSPSHFGPSFTRGSSDFIFLGRNVMTGIFCSFWSGLGSKIENSVSLKDAGSQIGPKFAAPTESHFACPRNIFV